MTIHVAMCHYITHADLMDFQPMKANIGILPMLDINLRMDRSERSRIFIERV